MEINPRLQPPTDMQKERVRELKNHPAFASGVNLDWLYDAMMNRNMLKNKGTCGILINEMKKKIDAYPPF